MKWTNLIMYSLCVQVLTSQLLLIRTALLATVLPYSHESQGSRLGPQLEPRLRCVANLKFDQ
jgi:hypothetical protein